MSSMTPPIRMVSVPVEPTEAMMLAADAVDWNNEDERAAIINMWQAMLTAAPVREEGGSWSAVRNVFVTYAGRFSQAARYEEASAIADMAAHDLAALATREEAPAPYEGITDDCRSWPPEPCGISANAEWHEHYSRWHGRYGPAALARRAATKSSEEDPAEAGEIGAEYDDAAHCVTLAECPPGLFLWNGTLGFKSEYGAMEPVGISPHHQQWKVGNRVDAYCADSGEYFWGGTSNHDDRAKLLVYPISAETVAMVASHGPSALRAQPQAREDAQPVGHFQHSATWSAWEEVSPEYAGSEGVVPLYRHPAPDALRVAVEALGRSPAIEELTPTNREWVECVSVQDRYDLMKRRLGQALAALQAEQKGGA